MNKFEKIIEYLSNIISKIGQVLLIMMVLFISVTVVFRNINLPLIGDIEITSLLMVIIVNIGMLYTQTQEGHIKIGLIVDKFPEKIQKLVNIMESIFIFVVTLIATFVYYHTSIRFFQNPEYTDLLSIPLYPLKFIIFISFLLWTLVALINIQKNIVLLLKS